MSENIYKYVELSKIFQITKIYTAFKARYDKTYYFDGEYHNFWEIVFVVDGEIGVTAGSEALVLKKGQAIIHEPMEFHRLWSEGETCPEIVIFSFAAENMPKYSSKIFEVDDINKPGNMLSKILEVFEFNDSWGIKIKEDARFAHQLVIKELETFILKTISHKITEKTILKSRTAENYATIVNILENNVEKNLSVPEIAKMCNMSDINLKKTFSKYSGMGIIKYFNHMKITAAGVMIRQGKSVQETAEALGFSNQNYFSTVFRKIMGCSPTKYRK